MAKRQQEIAIFEEELAEVFQPDEVGLADPGPLGQGIVHAGNGWPDDNDEV